MAQFEALALALEDWFDCPLDGLPDVLRKRVEQEFFPMPWGRLSADQRRSLALQLDYQHDPATERDRQFWGDFFQHVDELKQQIAAWDAVAAPTAAELANKEARLAQLQQELSRMVAQQRVARGDYFPEPQPAPKKQDDAPAEPVPPVRYVAYPKAMHKLIQRLGATPEELAAWVWAGPQQGGIAAYVNANELEPPPRFFYGYLIGSPDYIAPLMRCWFNEEDVEQFNPAERYIVGAALIERWSKQSGLNPKAFIQAKVAESRLLDIHPTYGGTRATFSEHEDWPELETGLFSLIHVEAIEAEDFVRDGDVGSVVHADETAPAAPSEDASVGSPEWRKQNAKKAANALHDKPGGSRDKREQIRTAWASGKYSSRDLCAEQECAALSMSFAAARRALINTPKPRRC